jgi:hypothetical protein
VHVRERARRHQLRRLVGRAVTVAGAGEPGGERERGDRRERGEVLALERRDHAARRRCLRSAKSMITGIPSSA